MIFMANYNAKNPSVLALSSIMAALEIIPVIEDVSPARVDVADVFQSSPRAPVTWLRRESHSDTT